MIPAPWYLAIAVIAGITFFTGLWVGREVEERNTAKISHAFAEYRNEVAQQASDAAIKQAMKLNAQIAENDRLERQKNEADQQIDNLRIALDARLGAIRLCRAAPRTAPGVPTAPDRGPDGDPPPDPADVLPAQAGSDLVTLAADADKVRAQADMCRAWAQSIRERYQ